jgi:DNA-binding response OmpR family regulator
MSTEEHRILVVDDEQDTCANLQDILTDLGYQVDVAYDGPTALQLAKKSRYDVALLDLKMPGMDGLELYRRIKQLRAGTVAMIVTAYAGSETAQSAMAAGAWKILPKPVDFPKLMALVEQALDQPLVMLVDDDQELCDSLWDLLRERGFRVCVAHDAKAAAERLEEREHKVVLIDMKLPEGDGREVFQAVRTANPEARTVIITGHRGELEERVAQVLSEGADAVCYKPFDVGNLLTTLQSLVK